MFRFNQTVTTPKGPATFIGVVGDGTEVQVSRMARWDELTTEEIESRKPNIREWFPADVAAWLKKATYCKNEIYPIEDVTA